MQSDVTMNLVIRAGPNLGQSFQFTGQSKIIGRGSGSDIMISDNSLSRKHAAIHPTSNGYIVEDLGSSNGTFINNQRVTGSHLLRSGDSLRLGNTVTFTVGFVGTGVTPDNDGTFIDRGVAPVYPPTVHPAQTVAPQQSSTPWVRILLTIVVLLGIGVIAGGMAYYYMLNSTAAPTISIVNPPNNSTGIVGQELIVQAVVVDEKGLNRIELWVDNQLIRADVVPGEAKTHTSQQGWIPNIAGSHLIEIKAINSSDVQNASPNIVTIMVTEVDTGGSTEASIAGTEVDTDGTTEADIDGTEVSTSGGTATDTGDAEGDTLQTSTPTPVEPGQPTFTASTNLNIRTGPGTVYPRVGSLAAGQSIEVVGRDQSGNWLQVLYPSGPDGKGWLSAAAEYGSATNSNNLPVVVTPPPPTATSLPVQSNTPTSTPTQTPTQTPTPTANSGSCCSAGRLSRFRGPK